jgi:hypothetical protein
MALRQIFRRTFRALDHRIYQRIMRTERIILKLRLKAKDVRRETGLLKMIHILEGRSLVPKGGANPHGTKYRGILSLGTVISVLFEILLKSWKQRRMTRNDFWIQFCLCRRILNELVTKQ